jgi:membrane protein DedA with SNARE-associated domain
MTGLLHGGAYAVFALMAVDALFPVGGELIMLYAGALAAGAIAGQTPVLLGWHPHQGLAAYIVLASAGALGYLLGSLAGWAIGVRGGHHVDPSRLERAEHWLDRFGSWAVFLGRLTPVVRSFISIPSGVMRYPLAPYTLLTLAGSAIWCFGFAAAGWAAGHGYEHLHRSTRFADYAVVAALVVVAVIAVRHLRAQRTA